MFVDADAMINQDGAQDESQGRGRDIGLSLDIGLPFLERNRE